MASIDVLPADQRAVLELVLRRGRTYDEIAQLLSIDRAGVRQRALSALDALGPDADVPAERRALITDYLLGALPPRVTDQVRERLARSAPERAWARVIASELEPISSRPLPEIPPGAEAPRTEPVTPPGPQADASSERDAPTRERRERAAPPAEPSPEQPRRRRAGRRERKRDGRAPLGPRPPLEPGRERPASRRGGKIVLAAAAIIVLAIVLSLALGGGSSKKTHTTAAGRTSTTPALSTTNTTPTTSTTTGGAKLLGQINLNSPSGGSAKGIAEVVRAAGRIALLIYAQNLQPNTKQNAYAVWLYNSSSDSHLLGFVNPPVGSTGKLQTQGVLPSNASHFKQLVVTLETQANPTTPGTILLQGTLKGVP